MRGLDVLVLTGCPPMPTVNTLSDYRRVDGIMIPHRIHQVSEACGTERAMIFITKSIEHNVKMPKDRFELPLKVQLGIADGSAHARGCDEKGRPACGDQGAPEKAVPPDDGEKNKKK